MSLQNRQIEQCTAEEAVVACMDASYGLPGMQAVRAVRDDIGVGKMKLAAAITAQGVPTESDAALATMATNVAAIVAHLLNTNDESVELTFSGNTPTTILGLLMSLSSVLTIRKKTEGNDGALGVLSQSPAIKVTWDEDVYIGASVSDTTLGNNIQEACAPKAIKVKGRQFLNTRELRILYIPKVYTVADSYYWLGGSCTKLIDMTIGESFAAGGTYTFLSTWNPTEALLTNSTSLVEDGETFSSNREKLLYNIREHFAALLPTVTTTSKIQLNSTLKAAIDADNATASAFSNKGWTLYS